jgi:aryl-alcohol dehydrogenase-like predicted oxidoreductase
MQRASCGSDRQCDEAEHPHQGEQGLTEISCKSMLSFLPFGKTGHRSSRLLFGAAALGNMSQESADTTLDIVLRRGINHIDTAASYGASEQRLAPWLALHGKEVFLATKTGMRAGAAARAELEQSLQRMGVDSVDLIQLHNLVEEEEWQQAFALDGAVAALFAAREEGLCHHIGITGHGPRSAAMHLRSLNQADFASVLLPYNHIELQNDSYAADVEKLLAECAERDVAVQTIKSLAKRRWRDSSQQRLSWYEPIENREAAARAIHFVLATPQVFLNTSSDARLLELTCDAAESFTGTAPHPEQLSHDRMVHAMAPIFDSTL